MAIKCRILESGICDITCAYKKGIHNGVDIVDVNSKGTHILGWEVAHSDGTVVAVRNNCNYNTYPNGEHIYGNYVKIKHDDGYYTLYAHIKYGTVQVKVGQRVKRGTRLGYMGNTGYSNGGHCHFEVRNPSDVTINPTPYLNADLPQTTKVNVYYKVRTKEDGWLPEVKNLDDYAGQGNHTIIDFMVKVDKGSIWYQAHIKGGKWLPKVTGYNINDFYNGYAGESKPIDCVRICYKDNGKKAKYKINNCAWQYNDEYDKYGENFGGIYGKDAKELRISIE